MTDLITALEHAEQVKKIEEENKELKKRIKELEDALRPFAIIADSKNELGIRAHVAVNIVTRDGLEGILENVLKVLKNDQEN